jgi:hypothetical protein
MTIAASASQYSGVILWEDPDMALSKASGDTE